MLASIQNEAHSVVQRLGLSGPLALLERAWEAEIGGLAPMARLVAIDRAALVVEVDSSVALQEISLRRRELVRRVNRHLPHEFVKHLTVRMAQYDGR